MYAVFGVLIDVELWKKIMPKNHEFFLKLGEFLETQK